MGLDGTTGRVGGFIGFVVGTEGGLLTGRWLGVPGRCDAEGAEGCVGLVLPGRLVVVEPPGRVVVDEAPGRVVEALAVGRVVVDEAAGRAVDDVAAGRAVVVLLRPRVDCARVKGLREVKPAITNARSITVFFIGREVF